MDSPTYQIRNCEKSDLVRILESKITRTAIIKAYKFIMTSKKGSSQPNHKLSQHSQDFPLLRAHLFYFQKKK